MREGDLARERPLIGERSRGAALYISAAALCFLLARTRVLGSYSPLGTALCAALPGGYALAGGIGGSLGCMLPMGGVDPFRYAVAMMAAAILRWLLGGFLRGGRRPQISSLIAAAATAVTGFALLGAAGSTGVMVVGVETLMAGGASFFFAQAIPLLLSRRALHTLTAAEMACVAVAGALALTSLDTVRIFAVSPARIGAVFLLLCAAAGGREAMGAVIGAAVGFAFSLSGGNFTAAGLYAFSGLAAGVFSAFGRFGSALSLILVTGIAALHMGASPAAYASLVEAALGTAVFLLLPQRAMRKIASAFTPPAELPRTDGLRHSLVMRLRFASRALTDVSSTVEEVASRLARLQAPDFEHIFGQVEREACRGCGLELYCWETVRGETLEALVAMSKSIRQEGRVAPGSAPAEFDRRCLRQEEVGDCLFRHFTNYLTKQSAERRVEEIRTAVADQFSGIASMLGDMAAEFEQAERYDADMAARIDATLRASGIAASDVTCTLDRFDRMTVEVQSASVAPDQVNRSELMQELSEVCGRAFDPPCVTSAGGAVLFTIMEHAEYTVDFGAAQLACDGARMCGDTYDFFHDGKGRAVLLLSDGMGSGGRAAVDSAMASGLMSRLLKAGFGFDCSLKIVNSAMLFKSSDESLATLDVACLDLFSGQTELLKAGAPPTVIRRGGHIGIAECGSLPAGILREIGFESARVGLAHGDAVVMLSDGAALEGTDWIRDEMAAWRDSAQALAEKLADEAYRRRSDGHQDDITVLVAILQKNYA